MPEPAPPDPFSLLGLEPVFRLDEAVLEARHRELAAALHPDRHHAEAPRARRQALGAAIEVNAAFRQLRDPVRRAEALLVRRGWAVAAGSEPRPAPELLMDVMEQREALAVARRARDRASLERLTRGMVEREAALVDRLGELLDEPAAEAHADAALRALVELRYTRRFLDEVRAIEDELD
ncbi:MAG: Fe-S protein assembly co-chaperone HscB [Polyangiaceae bacterium]|nr:Fe-S protein assembly co-chaperone HscB [Polyangiaceae bacterium]